jgi:death-on-curing protein
MRWISKAVALSIHDESIRDYGGQDGLRDEGLLESALARPQQRHAYDESATLIDLAAAYCAGIVKNHPFIDGNKRTGYATCGTFLLLNGYRFQPERVEAVLTIEGLAAGRVDEEQLVEWIARNTQPRS